jgi:hypothetical protein
MNSNLTKNKTNLFDVLKLAKIDTVLVAYSGSGDSGSVDGAKFFVRGKTLSEEKVESLKEKYVIKDWMSPYGWNSNLGEREYNPIQSDLVAAVDDLCYSLLSEYQPGWEINDGSSGEFSFNVKARTISFEHDEFYTESNHVSREL